jgi:hypothetical protein
MKRSSVEQIVGVLKQAEVGVPVYPRWWSRNRSGQSTLEPFRTTAFNKVTATHSIKK